MKVLCLLLVLFVSALYTQTIPEDNGLGSMPLEAEGISGSHVVKGQVWDDLNRNGIYEKDTEPGVAGIMATLYHDSSYLFPMVHSVVIGTETSDANGVFMFSCLNSGRYSVMFSGLPEGMEYTFTGQGNEAVDSDAIVLDEAQGTAQTSEFIISGPERETYTLGVGITEIVLIGEIQGFVWNDANYNGIQETTEDGVEGVIVTLMAEGASLMSTTTDMDGVFYFKDLIPGFYSLSFDISPLGSGFAFTTMSEGTVKSRDSDVNDDGMTPVFEVPRGIVVTEIDAGVVPSPGFLEGFFFVDQDTNGVQSEADLPLSGQEIQLLDRSENVLMTLTTNSEGRFSVEVDSIAYYVQVVYDPAALSPTAKNVGNDPSIDSELNADGRTDLVQVNPGRTTSVAGGFVPLLATALFTVWRDINDDSILTPQLGDSFQVGYMVELLNSEMEVVESAMTGDDGAAPFRNIQPGQYAFRVMLPAEDWGFVTFRASGDRDDPLDSDISQVDGLVGMTEMIQFGVGDLRDDLGAGMRRLFSSIRGLVFQDFNRNGVRDGTDTSMSGIVVYLLDSEGILTSTETDFAGDFVFGQLDPAVYGVQIAPESLVGFLLAPQDVGQDDNVDSDFPQDGSPLEITLGTNEQYCCADAGLSSVEILPASIEGFIWDDYNERTGIQTGNDRPISGISVLLRDQSGATISTATSSGQGLFNFRDVVPGTYELVAVLSVHTLSPFKQGTDPALDSDFEGFGTTGFFEISEGQQITDLDLGLIPRDGVVTGRVWFDQTPDGIRGSEEVGLAGVVVSILNLGFDVVDTTETLSSGSYTFNGVQPNTYLLKVDRPSTGWVFSPQDQGDDDRFDSDVSQEDGISNPFEVAPQQTVSSLDAGLRF